ncbi:unnamed protein product [Bursaphelenchus okinawaensis]|uniref:Uncharacterized protein n=1 Tax=Bursaphelenchus okinawaensis TaxID=465554 RepID=A0A811KI46_9BILA|nr:unnamed protein product [Bursaphelenchus okinawaensis]CAG9103501.1 unnamed protein product [Bursaphelenchus okinawaensis]
MNSLFRSLNPLRFRVQQFSTTPIVFKGHSKWQNIREVKGKNDALRSQQISWFLKKIRNACKNGGFDPKFNKDLEKLQNEYKAKNLPSESMAKYMARLRDKPDVTHFYDIIGPSGSFIIVEAETDSYNRTKGLVLKYMKKVGGFRMSDSSLKSRFEEKGKIVVEPKKSDGSLLTLEEMEEVGIELDCEEVVVFEKRDEGVAIELTVENGKMHKVESALGEKGYVVENSQVKLIPLHAIEVSEQDMDTINKFYEYMDEVDEVQQIHDNISESEDEQATATA